jgi:hypothetical protein
MLFSVERYDGMVTFCKHERVAKEAVVAYLNIPATLHSVKLEVLLAVAMTITASRE